MTTRPSTQSLAALTVGGAVAVCDLAAQDAYVQPLAQALAVTAIAWSPDNTLLAVATLGKVLTVVLYTHSGAVHETVLLDVVEPRGIRCMCLGESGRTIWFAGDSMVVHNYDRAAKRIVSSFKGHTASVTCLVLNVSNSHIASGSSAGHLILFNTTTGHATPLEVGTTQEITKAQFSWHKKGLLAAASDDGKVRLWDTQESTRPVHVFEGAHIAPVKGLVFSPMNSVLMLSAGLDKRLVIYNLEKRTVIKTVHAPEPLTALSYKYSTESNVVAVGTLNGNILLYNLQSLSAPLDRLSWFEDGKAVHTIVFQYTPALTSVPRSSNSKSGNTDSGNTSNNNNNNSSNRSTGTMTKPPTAPIVPPDARPPANSSELKASPVSTAHDVTTSTPSIIQPVAAAIPTVDVANASAVIDRALALTAPKVLGTPDLFRLNTTTTSDSTPAQPSSLQASSNASSRHTLPPITATLPPESPMAPPATTPAPELRATLEELGTTPQAQMVRRVVEDAMLSFRSMLHADIQNLHLELLRQFQLQKMELLEVMRQHSPTQELLEELRQLREENRRLRHMY